MSVAKGRVRISDNYLKKAHGSAIQLLMDLRDANAGADALTSLILLPLIGKASSVLAQVEQLRDAVTGRQEAANLPRICNAPLCDKAAEPQRARGRPPEYCAEHRPLRNTLNTRHRRRTARLRKEKPH